jgi:hypothetical protein
MKRIITDSFHLHFLTLVSVPNITVGSAHSNGKDLLVNRLKEINKINYSFPLLLQCNVACPPVGARILQADGVLSTSIYIYFEVPQNLGV